MQNDDPIEVRVGTFFVVMGMGIFLLFVVSDVADMVEFDYFFVSVVLLAIGYYFRRKKAPPPPANRFAWFKGTLGKFKGFSRPKGKGGGKGKQESEE
ncbi:MAG: hypothetical protein JETCAE01_21000 [Anaerolineaceae bacterium]|nr:MAG: hypothetical protein EDM79_05605 [Chloroflexota bacterium]GJQ36090.1 MAG: hypothetical protein JETCAE01_21000 [Anaerolineaceae bacterium]